MNQIFDSVTETKNSFFDALEALSLTPTECAELLDLADAAFEAVRSTAFDEGFAAGKSETENSVDFINRFDFF